MIKPPVGNGTWGRLFVFWKATIRHAALRFCQFCSRSVWVVFEQGVDGLQLHGRAR